ncbi:hypothetical protein N7522_000393 [Penicillium canescens]|uniref:Uncharacterized protein n=1 Tax=Penicillium canescens TaxID=5083 RepID=A0AAD6N7V0_PENCN|nr:hypothetical protein N7522_000393 [Penicillium canescens]KAJ6038733.1 hypothetical protein N7460_007450 [Penicillium canescens]
MSAESKAVAETLWDTSLRSDAQWRTWIAKVEAAATKGNVWHYMNPNLSEDEVRKAPVDSRDSYPHPREINEDATDVSQLSDAEYKRYQRLTSEFDKETSWNESIRTKINKVDALIDANVAPEHRHILEGKVTPHEKLVRLKQQFEPKGDTSRQSVRNAWRDLVRRPIGRISIDKWLATWSNLYEEGKAMNIPDIAYHDDKGNPQDRDAIRDFLQAVESFDEVFVSLWRKDIMNKDFRISFQDILAAYRNHRNAKGVVKSPGNSSSIAFAATLNEHEPQEGQNSAQGSHNSREPRSNCVCGSSRHHWKNCFHINASKRPPGWKPYEDAAKRVEQNIKKLNAEKQKELRKFMKDNGQEKTAQLALTQADDVSTETLIFFTVSPFVFKTALTHPLAACWIIDSGANTHISNQRDRFITFTKEEREVVLGSGKAIAQGRGTAKICVNQPGGGTIWVHLKDVWDPSQDLRPNLSNLRLYGCRAYVMRQGIAKSDKMEPRAEIGYLVGYVASNIWKIWLPQLNQVREFRDVVFDENIQYNPSETAVPIAPAIHDVGYWDTEHTCHGENTTSYDNTFANAYSSCFTQ